MPDAQTLDLAWALNVLPNPKLNHGRPAPPAPLISMLLGVSGGVDVSVICGSLRAAASRQR